MTTRGRHPAPPAGDDDDAYSHTRQFIVDHDLDDLGHPSDHALTEHEFHLLLALIRKRNQTATLKDLSTGTLDHGWARRAADQALAAGHVEQLPGDDVTLRLTRAGIDALDRSAHWTLAWHGTSRQSRPRYL